MSNRISLEEKIHRAIPISTAMGFHIEELSQTHIVITAPLEPNINIHGTGFAGSIYSLGTLSAWALVTHILEQQNIDAELVIARAEIKYSTPVKNKIQCRCEVSEQQKKQFLDKLNSKNSARFETKVKVGTFSEARLNVALHAKIKS